MSDAATYKNYGNAKSFPAKLQLIADTWKKLQEGPLRHRETMLKLWASGYFDPGYGRTHTINLMDRGVSTLVPFLTEGNPRILVETQIPELRGWSYTTQLALNFFIEKLKLAETVLIPAAINSMFGAGITRTSFYYDRTISENDVSIKLGTPNVEVIDDSCYIGDPSAKRRADFTLEGDMYTLPTDYAKDFFAGKDKHGNEIADYITADSSLAMDYDPRRIANPSWDKKGLSLRDFTTFIDFYLYDENTIVTIMPKGRKAKILREVEWDGPAGGPYDYLGYKFFPNTANPLPPAWSWHDLDTTMSLLIDKMREQAESQKNILAYSAEVADDVKEVVKTPNNGTVRVANVDAMKPISLGGVNELNYQWVNYVEMEFSKQGAASDVMGGRGVNAPTLGQEQLIYSNASRIVNNMYSRFMCFTTSIVKKLAWAFWTDPSTYVPVIKEIPGVGELPVRFSSVEKVGDFYDFVFKIVPYSTQRNSPELQFQKIMQLMSQWILPTQQLAAAQGQQVDYPLVTKILGDYLGVDTMNQWYKSAVPDMLEGQAQQMLPMGQSGKSRKNAEGQTSDAFGATIGNMNANLNRYEQSPEKANNNQPGSM
jgi:hypothetical protein